MTKLIKMLSLLLLMGMANDCIAQKQGQALIDSLLRELPKAKEDTNKVNLLSALSYAHYTINPDEGIKYGMECYSLAGKLGWKKGIANSNLMIGNNYFTKADYTKALDYWTKALNSYKETDDKKGIASASGVIGNYYMRTDDYPKALEWYFKALKMKKEIGDKNTASITGNIGMVYYQMGDYPKSLEYDFKALQLHEESGKKQGMASMYSNIGIVYFYLADYSKALEYDAKALAIGIEIGDKNAVASAHQNMGLVYSTLRNYGKALEYYLTSLKEFDSLGDQLKISEATACIAEVYFYQKNYAMSIEYYQRAIDIANQIGSKYLAGTSLCNLGDAFLTIAKDSGGKQAGIKTDAELSIRKYSGTIPAGKTALLHKAIGYLLQSLAIGKEINNTNIEQHSDMGLVEAYKLNGDYKKALEADDDYHASKDSVFSKENNGKIVRLEMQNQYDKQHIADSLKTREKENITALQLQRQRSYTAIGIAGILLLVGFSFFIVKERGKSERERKKSDDLLLNILPEEVAAELKANGATKARHFNNVTVMFTDFVNFTIASERLSPQALIDELHTCFKAFDEITGKYNIEKIKTIGDAYLAVCGMPVAHPAHAENIIRAAIEINAFMNDRVAKLGNSTFAVRIGIHTGSVVAGIVGVKKFAYDIWGDTVNTAARMEQNSEAGKINISQSTYDLIKNKFACEYRGGIAAKNKGQLNMYFVTTAKLG